MFNKDLALQKTVSEIAEHRNKAIYNIEQMAKHLNIFRDECRQISQYCGNVRHLAQFNVDSIRKEVDRSSWRKCFNMTGLDSYMDKKARDEFDKSLEVDPPEFTTENIRMILLSKMNEAESMFKRGIVATFKRLNGDFKCHDSFKLNKKLICSYWFVKCRIFGGVDTNYNYVDEITDFERALLILDGKKFIKPELAYQLKETLKSGDMTFENEYFKLRAYKNGNGHITMKRLDLVDKINEIIAEWHGEGKVAKR